MIIRHRQTIRNYGAIVARNAANSSCDSACYPSGLTCCSGCYLGLLVELSLSCHVVTFWQRSCFGCIVLRVPLVRSSGCVAVLQGPINHIIISIIRPG